MNELLGRKVDVVETAKDEWRIATSSDREVKSAVVESVGKELAHLAVRDDAGHLRALIGVRLTDIPADKPAAPVKHVASVVKEQD